MSYTAQTWATGDTITAEKLNHMEDGIADASVGVEELTYAQLKAKRDGGTLKAGRLYRITDFVTVINGSYDVSAIAGQTAYVHYAKSAGHAFDIIVMALDASTLDEHAVATQHSGDTYFANSALEMWDVRYTIDNDPTKYSWADATKGKGVITYLKDEFNNEAWYDFKNIQMLAYAMGMADPSADPDSLCYDASTQPNRYCSVNGVMTAIQEYLSTGTYTSPYGIHDFAVGAAILTSIGYPTADAAYLSAFNADFYYTFDYLDGNGVHHDHSLNSGGKVMCYENSFAVCQDVLASALHFAVIPQGINGTIFENIVDDAFNSGNRFGANCWENVFGSSCYSNTFGDYCYSNIFGDSCYSNTFGDYCYSNIFGDSFRSNTFGGYCRSNTFWNECAYNTFGGGCYNNTFGSGCVYNTFGDVCDNNTFGNSCNSNTFWSDCYINTFGDNCRYYRLLSGTNDYSNAQASRTYETWVGLNSSDVLKEWCPMDGAT